MITTPGLDFTQPAKLSGARSVGSRPQAARQAVRGSQDSIALSAGHGDRFRMELVGRMSQEVRATASTGNVQALRLAVSAGTYHPDPAVIASRMLLMED